MRAANLSETPIPPGWSRLLQPDWYASSLFDVTAEKLKGLGIEGVMFDLDNTLTEWRSNDITADVQTWVKTLHDAGLKMCVVSNTHRRDRLQRLCQLLEVDYVLGVTKPRRRGYRTALAKIKTAPEKTAFVGDQIFTDILGGNRMGLYTILVPPLSQHEFLGTKILSRRMEKLLFSYLKRTRRYPPESR